MYLPEESTTSAEKPKKAYQSEIKRKANTYLSNIKRKIIIYADWICHEKAKG